MAPFLFANSAGTNTIRRAGVLVQWLWETTHVQEVVGSNPGTVPILDGHFFTLICSKDCIVCLKSLKINEKEAGNGTFLFTNTIGNKQPSKFTLWTQFLQCVYLHSPDRDHRLCLRYVPRYPLDMRRRVTRGPVVTMAREMLEQVSNLNIVDQVVVGQDLPVLVDPVDGVLESQLRRRILLVLCNQKIDFNIFHRFLIFFKRYNRCYSFLYLDAISFYRSVYRFKEVLKEVIAFKRSINL